MTVWTNIVSISNANIANWQSVSMWLYNNGFKSFEQPSSKPSDFCTSLYYYLYTNVINIDKNPSRESKNRVLKFSTELAF